MDATDCEQSKSADCCYCKNMAYYKLKHKIYFIKEICNKYLKAEALTNDKELGAAIVSDEIINCIEANDE